MLFVRRVTLGYLKVVGFTALLAFSLVLSVGTHALYIPLARTSNGLYLNWSGYAVSVSDVTSVSGTFTVPTVSGPATVGGLSTDVSVWVGIDGYTSGTVEQTGVSGSIDPKTNTVSYYAWWEMYPRSSTKIRAFSVSHGDHVTASVSYLSGGSFKLSISDLTNGASFTTTARAPQGGPGVAQRNSAEWVVERAATIYKGYLTILPLATFDSATFTSESFAVSNGSPTTLQDAVTNYSEYSGAGTPPTQPYWENMVMVGLDSSGNPYPLVTTSAVSSGVFTVVFLANGTPYPIPGIFRH